MDQEKQRDRLAAAVRERRRQLQLSVTKAAQLAGVHRGTWISIEDGKRIPHDRNWAKIESAMDWAPGSVELILCGGRATQVEDLMTHSKVNLPEIPVDDVLNWAREAPYFEEHERAAILVLIEAARQRQYGGFPAIPPSSTTDV